MHGFVRWLSTLLCGTMLAGCAARVAGPAVPAPTEQRRGGGASVGSGETSRRLAILRRQQPIVISPHAITVLLSITGQGYRVRGRAVELSVEDRARIDRFFPAVGGRLGGQALHDYLQELKQRYPRSRQLSIYAPPSTPYRTLVEAMDASREGILHGPGGARPALLFPEVVFVSTETP